MAHTDPGLQDTILPLAQREFDQIRRLAYQTCGLDLRAGKQDLVNARLRRLVREGGFRSFQEYYTSVVGDRTGAALGHMIDALTTHHTAFLRERDHFDFLSAHAQESARGRGLLEVWSAACSTGEEVWSLACVLTEALPSTEVRIWGTDVSGKALGVASEGVYSAESCRDLPAGWLSRYFRGQGERPERYRVAPELRSKVRFCSLNLMERPSWPQRFPVVFCRNVMIYFDQPTQERVVRHLETYLEPGGYLFIGHAESLARIRHSLEYVQPAIYRRPAAAGDAPCAGRFGPGTTAGLRESAGGGGNGRPILRR